MWMWNAHREIQQKWDWIPGKGDTMITKSGWGMRLSQSVWAAFTQSSWGAVISCQWL